MLIQRKYTNFSIAVLDDLIVHLLTTQEEISEILIDLRSREEIATNFDETSMA